MCDDGDGDATVVDCRPQLALVLVTTLVVADAPSGFARRRAVERADAAHDETTATTHAPPLPTASACYERARAALPLLTWLGALAEALVDAARSAPRACLQSVAPTASATRATPASRVACAASTSRASELLDVACSCTDARAASAQRGASRRCTGRGVRGVGRRFGVRRRRRAAAAIKQSRAPPSGSAVAGRSGASAADEYVVRRLPAVAEQPTDERRSARVAHALLRQFVRHATDNALLATFALPNAWPCAAAAAAAAAAGSDGVVDERFAAEPLLLLCAHAPPLAEWALVVVVVVCCFFLLFSSSFCVAVGVVVDGSRARAERRHAANAGFERRVSAVRARVRGLSSATRATRAADSARPAWHLGWLVVRHWTTGGGGGGGDELAFWRSYVPLVGYDGWLGAAGGLFSLNEWRRAGRAEARRREEATGRRRQRRAPKPRRRRRRRRRRQRRGRRRRRGRLGGARGVCRRAAHRRPHRRLDKVVRRRRRRHQHQQQHHHRR